MRVMSEPLYIGIDLGTTGVKACLADGAGRVLAVAARECELTRPAPGFAEFDAEAYAARAFDAACELLAGLGAGAARVRAIGLCSQAQTFVLLDESGRAVRPAISWLDVRAEAETADFNAVCRREGLRSVDAIASGPKVLWVRRHEPELMGRVRRAALLPDYLAYLLTGRAVTDLRMAESTGCYDPGRGGWLPPLLGLCGLDAAMMSEVRWPGDAIGPVRPDVAARLGVPRETLVAVGALDQLAGAIAVGNVAPGRISAALGTALAVVATVPAGTLPPPGVVLRPHPVRGLSFLLTFAKTAGIVLRWFRQEFAPALGYDELFAEIERVPIGCGGLACLPHFAGMATPTFDPSVRGAFRGLTLGHTRAHLARAIVEALTFTLRENLELLGPAVDPAARLPVTGGGARSDVWLQMIADVTGRPVERPAAMEAPSLGAAILAMVADGRYPSIADAAARVYAPARTFTPDPARGHEYAEPFRRYRSCAARVAGEKAD